jgi:ParB family chromosome partitioning protein
MIRNIPLNKLLPSKRNVRRRSDPQADLQLKADIEARGLLQNLVVCQAKKPRGKFTVEAGERRMRALKALAGEGKLPANHEVCCLLLDGGGAAAQEAGLAENFQRLAMNPADECLAFQGLIEQGADVEGIARRFGLTVRFVEGRLRLASLAPVVFEALGAGAITLDVAKAYAATPDVERQAYVFEQIGRSYGSSHPDSIRRMMTQATASAGDRRARLVGEDAYVAAGGRIERDLFSEETGTRWLDVALLERLAGEKMAAIAAEMEASAGLAFVRPSLESWIGGAQTAGLHRVPLEVPAITEDERAEIERLEAEIQDLVDQLEAEEMDDDARAAAEAAWRTSPGRSRRSPTVRRCSPRSSRARSAPSCCSARMGSRGSTPSTTVRRRSRRKGPTPARIRRSPVSAPAERIPGLRLRRSRRKLQACRRRWSTSWPCSGGTFWPSMSPPIRRSRPTSPSS